MAYLKNPKDFGRTSKLNIHNWKTLESTGNGVNIIVDFQRYHIYDCDITEIIQANLQGKRFQLEKIFHYIHNELSCILCEGRGKLDWIHNVTKPTLYGMLPEYKRHEKGQCFMITTHDSRKILLSSQYIPKGFEQCNKCYGSGLDQIRANIKSKEEVTIDAEMPKM